MTSGNPINAFTGAAIWEMILSKVSTKFPQLMKFKGAGDRKKDP